MLCPACGTENGRGRKFCGECGSALALTCAACGSPNAPGVKFCGKCGAPLGFDAPSPSAPAPAAERKVVTVLFADLVGFTAASEGRDAEDTRELLTRYWAERGDAVEARRVLSLQSALENSADVQERGSYAVLRAVVLRAEGRHEEALASSLDAITAAGILGHGLGADPKIAFGVGLDSALVLGQLETVDELLGRIDAIAPGRRAPSLRANAARFRARLAAARGETTGVEQGFKTASAIFREHGLVFHLAVTELEHAEWLTDQGRGGEAEPLYAEAREVFERLEAAPWLERAQAARGVVAA